MNLSFSCVKETCLYVSDLQRTKAFYHGKLGLPVISFVDGRHVFFKAGNSVLLCFIAEATKNDTLLPPHFGYGQNHFAFETAIDLYESWKQKIINEGIEIIQEVQWPKGGKSFYFHDPDTHLAEIVEQGIWDALTENY